ncbi:MAG: ATP-binding protein, partial [Bacteroidetes bacterium]|nr:ATP-binding protein [Bacteroidota bacterium]
VLIRSRKVDDQLELRILDEGPGFPQGPVSLTGAFHQGSRGMNRRHGGLGLGLHAAKKAISALNGSMQLQSRRDRSGASVMMRVPFTPANATLRSVSSPQDTSSLRRAA